MANIQSVVYPLSDPTTAHRQKLGEVLWGWRLCGKCSSRSLCIEKTCPWNREGRLQGFWKWYKQTTGAYVPELYTEEAALRSHEDLLDVIRLIKGNPDTKREDLTRQYFTGRLHGGGQLPANTDQHRAFNIAAQMLLMVNCTGSHQCHEFVEPGCIPFQWRSAVSISQFLSEVFPVTSHPSCHSEAAYAEIMNTVTAVLLIKRAKLRFEPTFDFGNHLRLDQDKGVVHLFQGTAVLKENLQASQNVSESATISEFIGIGNMSRDIILETLDTIYQVLFPPDLASQTLLDSLIRKHCFDSDLATFDSPRNCPTHTQPNGFMYFGPRIAILYEEIMNPTPRSWVQTWVQRKSGARHLMMATLISVIIAIVIGLCGLAVAIFQAWVSYQQWKHPIASR